MACKADSVIEGAALKVMPSFVADRIVSSLSSRIVHSDRMERLATTVNFNGVALPRPCLLWNSELVNHLLNRFAKSEIKIKADTAILRFAQPGEMTPLQCSKALFAKAISVGDVYDEGTENDPFIEEEDESIRYSLCQYLSTHPHTDFTDLAIQGQLLLVILNGSDKKIRHRPIRIGKNNNYVTRGE